MYLYLIECEGHHKIGIARDVEARRRNLQIGCPFQLTVARSLHVSGARWVERYLHGFLAQYAIQGEWFLLPADVLLYLLEIDPVVLSSWAHGDKAPPAELETKDCAPIDRERIAKRIDPNYESITPYLRKDTYRKVKIALSRDKRTVSDLIQELLSKWIEGRLWADQRSPMPAQWNGECGKRS